MNRGRERRGGNRRRSDSGGGWLPFVVGFAIGAFLGIINCHLDPDWIGSDEVDSDGKRKRKAGLLSGALAGVFGAGASEDSSGGDGQRAKSKDGYGTDEDGNSKSIAMSQAVRDKLDQDGKSSEASRGGNKGGQGSYGVSKTSGGANIPCEDVNAAGAVNKSPEDTTSSGGINKSSSSSGNRDDGISSNKETSGPAEDCMVIDKTKVKDFSTEDKAPSGKTSIQEVSGNSQKTAQGSSKSESTPIDGKKPCKPKAESKVATDGANSNTTATGGGGTSSKEQKPHPCPEKVTNTKEEGKDDSFSSAQKPGTTKELPDGHPCKTKIEQKKEMENVKEPCPEKKN